MNIEVHQPELEAIILQRMATGRFRDVEDVLIDALKLSAHRGPAESKPHLADVLAHARVLLDGEELDLTRDSAPGRPVDLA